MMPWWMLAVFVLGANFALWGSVGLVRLAESVAARRTGRATGTEPATAGLATTQDRGELMAVTAGSGAVTEASRALRPPRRPLTIKDVAVLIPAHDEALVIEESLRSIMALVPRGNVHVRRHPPRANLFTAMLTLLQSPARRAVETADPVPAPGPDPAPSLPARDPAPVITNTLNFPARVAEASHVSG